MNSRVLHCYAEGQDGAWEAICLDLDIAVQGGPFEEALLHRPAPFPVRLKFLIHALRGLFADRDGDRQRHQFTMLLAG